MEIQGWFTPPSIAKPLIGAHPKFLIGDELKMNCPIANAEQRLADAASFWKRAGKAYFDPDEFRRNVQASIQAFRSVTFMLQKMKELIPNFESWYSEQQAAMRQDNRLRWSVDARNQIEKQGDLNTKSKFIVEYINSWLPSERYLLDLPPSTRPKNLASVIASKIPISKRTEGAVLKISREWIDSELPEEELLSLLVYVYSHLQNLLIEAHHLINVERRRACRFYLACTSTNARLPKEMTKLHFPAVCWFSLQNGVLKEYDHLTKRLTSKMQKSALARYGNFPEISAKDANESSFAALCDKFFEMGKIMLKKDGHHIMFAMILSETGFQPFELRPADRADKHVMIRELAANCKRLRATSCILLGETWIANPSVLFGPYAVNYPNRKEALSLTGFHKDEGFQHRLAVFERKEDSIIFPAAVDQLSVTPGDNILLPVAEEIQSAWRA